MLDAFIIDELRRREQQDEQRDDNRLHVPTPEPTPRGPKPGEPERSREGFEMPPSNRHEPIVIDL